MKRCLAVVLILGCLWAESWQTIERDIVSVSNSYNKGKARELLRAYKPAVEAYTDALRRANELLENPGLRKEQALELLPYTIASAYRLALSTEKMVNGRMVYLYEQIEDYKQADELISTTLRLVSDSRIDRKVEISPLYYSHLYYARALNNLAMSLTLSSGTLWKKYLVYMPSDTVLIVQSVKADLQHYLYLNGLTDIPTPGAVTSAVEKVVSLITPHSQLESTLQLSYYSSETAERTFALTERIDKGVVTVLQRFGRDQELFTQVSQLTTYEDFEKSETSRQFIVELKTLLELLKRY